MRRRWRLYRSAERPYGWSTAALLFAAFVSLGLVSRLLCKDQLGDSSIWPANGAIVAAVLLLSKRQSLAVTLACFAFNVALNTWMNYATHALAVFKALQVAGLNVFVSYLAAYLARSLCGAAVDLSRFRRLATFVVIAFVSAGIEAVVGEIIDGVMPESGGFLRFWSQWTECDALGLVLATPAIMLAVKSRGAAATYDSHAAERWLLLAFAAALAVAAFSARGLPLHFLIYPLMVLIAFRAGPAWVLSSVLIVSMIVSALTTHGHGPLVVLSSNGRIVRQDLVQPFLVSLFLSTIPANNVLGEKLRAARRLRRVKASAEHGATHDALTTLVNRKLFQRRLNALLHAGTGVSIFVVDLDRFKQVNDSMGHEAGDELLRVFSARLMKLAPARATVARFGGDEFAVLMSNDASDPMFQQALCLEVIQAARTPFALVRGPAHVTASIGVASALREGGDAHELMRRADISLYAAKAAGRDGYRIFSEELDRTVRERAALEADLRRALERQGGEEGGEEEGGGLALHYQLKVDCAGRPSGVEALVRWRHPELGMVAPMRFIPIAEESGLIVRLGAWVFREAAAFAQRWPGLHVAVNVSPVQLRQPEFVGETLGALRESGVSFDRIEIEVTETALLDELSPATASLKALRAAGLKIALDDFGTGYSSLRHLHRFAVDRVKIDQSFVRALGESAESAAIVQAVIQLGHAMGLQVTAEGVETEEQRRYLVEAGVDELQGYLFSKPVEESALENRLIDAQVGVRAAA